MTDPLGEFEQLVLLALLQLGGEGYGVTVQQELAGRARREVSLGTIYKTLLRLEAKEMVQARIGEPTAERGGRRKKHYMVTASGSRSLKHSIGALRKMARGLDAAWGSN